MWGIFIIVFKPTGKLRHHSFGIRSIVAEDVIPFECFDESFSHTVALGAASRSKLADDAQRGGKSYCFSCRVAGAVVGEPFNWPQCFDIPKPFFNACQHDALRHVSTVPASGGGKAITSRSQVSRAKMARTRSPLSQAISNPVRASTLIAL